MIKLKDIALSFLKLGTTAFGGPAAHIAMMEEDFVNKRKWITREHFLDLLGVTNLIPGPNSTEMAIHIGYVKRGWKGLFIAGVCFILPAAAITLIFAYFYGVYGTKPELKPFIAGLRPAIIAVIFGAIYRLSKPIIIGSFRNRSDKDYFMLIAMLMVTILNIMGIDEIALLVIAGASGILWGFREGIIKKAQSLFSIYFLICIPVAAVLFNPQIRTAGASLSGLFLFFLKIGSILYGSGYVLVAYLQGGLVGTRHWLTQTQLLDAIAIGQFTPGPVLSTATFIGYLIMGFPGAAAATIAIFLPSFIFILITGSFIPRLRKSGIAMWFLNGVNAASLGLMLSVTFMLSATALVSWYSWVILTVSLMLIILTKTNITWILLGSAAAGWLLSLI